MTMSAGKETLCIQPSCPGHVMSKKSKSYALRECSIKKRKEAEHRKTQPRKRGPKPRPKTAPMSKYRRKTANLRERLRMGEINSAFENLRQKLPNPVQSGKGKCEKLTKINILHVAINYIRAMENLLETGDSGIRSFSEMTKNPLRDENDSKIEMQRILQVLMKKAEAKAAAAAARSAGNGGDLDQRLNGRNRKFGTESQNELLDGVKARLKREIKKEFEDDLDEDDDEDGLDEDELEDVDDDDFDDEEFGTTSFGEETKVRSQSFPEWKTINSFNSFSNSFPNSLQPQPQQQQQHHNQQQQHHNQQLLMLPSGDKSFPKPSPSTSSTPKAQFARSSTFQTSATFITTTTPFATSTTTSSHNSFSSTTSSPTTSVSSPDTSISISEVKRHPDPLFSSVTFEAGGHNSDEMIKEFFTDFVDLVGTLPDIDFEENFEMFP